MERIKLANHEIVLDTTRRRRRKREMEVRSAFLDGLKLTPTVDELRFLPDVFKQLAEARGTIGVREALMSDVPVRLMVDFVKLKEGRRGNVKWGAHVHLLPEGGEAPKDPGPSRFVVGEEEKIKVMRQSLRSVEDGQFMLPRRVSRTVLKLVHAPEVRPEKPMGRRHVNLNIDKKRFIDMLARAFEESGKSEEIPILRCY